jgi:hypothetical protein
MKAGKKQKEVFLDSLVFLLGKETTDNATMNLKEQYE